MPQVSIEPSPNANATTDRPKCWFVYVPAGYCEGQDVVNRTFHKRGYANETVASDTLVVFSQDLDSKSAEWITTALLATEEELVRQGIGANESMRNHYARVGYGENFPAYLAYGDVDLLRPRVVKRQVSTTDPIPDVYEAIMYGLNMFPFRKSPNVARNVLLVQYGTRTTTLSPPRKPVTIDQLRRKLQRSGFTLHVVVDNHFFGGSHLAFGINSSLVAFVPSGEGRTYRTVDRRVVHYVGQRDKSKEHAQLALQSGGTAWDILSVDINFQAFNSTFTEIFVRDVYRQIFDCQKCRCSEHGLYWCSPTSNQPKCDCLAKDGQVSDDWLVGIIFASP